ncbi:MAG: NAD-dependent epimerase/dehydratase family protein [Candidatus Caenarcaniphilales bacterium]|jgi:CDP-paratose 2-epimerase|nr:NAD-dependent epimerase/dehydratase family protein [Candidatus Caenarcaniphilales bacterium]
MSKNKIALITGSAGLIGAESCRFFADKGFQIIGIDNDMRSYFFGEEASTQWSRNLLEKNLEAYKHYSVDIRDEQAIENIFKEYSSDISIIIHTAAQPSHDWAAKEPLTDFSINANGTLILLENARKYCPEATFVFTSTNKVYGDTPNYLPLVELEKRWEIDTTHAYYEHGIDESMSIDATLHSLFGASKVAADVLVQEYGKYFGMKTAVFRGGCLTGPGHSGAALHGFLAYLAKCAVTGDHYKVLGYKGKQVRDNIHSYDLVNAFWHVHQKPRTGEVYNMGGGRYSNCSMQEAIEILEKITSKKMNYSYVEQNRVGDHIWWISDTNKFKSHYPNWIQTYDIQKILEEIVESTKQKHINA